MTDETDKPRPAPLYQEHLRLSAVFGDDRVPLHYPGTPEVDELTRGTVLADVGSALTLLMAGEPAPSFAHTAFAGRELKAGECAFEAVLTGDGALASVPLLARTGEAEYIAVDATPRAEVLDGWLSFLAGIEQNGVAPFAGLDTSDASGTHAMLLLWGGDAQEVLADYLGSAKAPLPGQVASRSLDRIPCIVAHLPGFGTLCYLVFVPPVHAATLWRSLLSFTQVTPVGTDDLMALATRALPWVGHVLEQGVVRLSADELAAAGLIRPAGDFVGARGLSA